MYLPKLKSAKLKTMRIERKNLHGELLFYLGVPLRVGLFTAMLCSYLTKHFRYYP
jgi:hypothetical protein